jgi:hypothetical protein
MSLVYYSIRKQTGPGLRRIQKLTSAGLGRSSVAPAKSLAGKSVAIGPGKPLALIASDRAREWLGVVDGSSPGHSR